MQTLPQDIEPMSMTAATAQEIAGELADAIACEDLRDRQQAADQLERLMIACPATDAIEHTVWRLIRLADLAPSRWDVPLQAAAEVLHEYYAGTLS